MRWDKPSDIPQSVVDDRKAKNTYVNLAVKRYGPTPTDDEFRQIIWERVRNRHRSYRKKVEKGLLQGEPEPPVEAPTTMEEYLKYYSDPAPNDLLAIQQLVSMGNQQSTVAAQIKDMLESDDISVTRWQSLARIQKDLSAESRQLQDSLGIARRIRDQRKEQTEISDRIQQNIRQAKELITDYGTKIVCPHCETAKVNQGFAINHFPEMGLTIKTRCPICLRDFEIVVPPHKWERVV